MKRRRKDEVVRTSYSCGTCGSDEYWVRPVIRIVWEASCGNGHIIYPVPGTDYHGAPREKDQP